MIREDRREEFEVLALPHLDRMYRFSLRLCRNADDAADLVQEAYYRGWRFFGSFKRGSDARAWLFRILYHAFIAEKGREQRRPVALADDDGAGEFRLYEAMVREGGWKDPLDLSPAKFGHLLGDEVIRALGRIPPAFRAPILLCDIEEMDYAAIAVALDIPVGTVRSRISRGRKLLAADLASYAKREGYFRKERDR